MIGVVVVMVVLSCLLLVLLCFFCFLPFGGCSIAHIALEGRIGFAYSVQELGLIGRVFSHWGAGNETAHPQLRKDGRS